MPGLQGPSYVVDAKTVAARRAFLNTLWTQHYAPKADRLLATSKALHAATSAYCRKPASRVAAQQAWRQVLEAWMRLMTVDGGPMRERFALRLLDSRYPSPELIRRAMQKEGEGEKYVDKVGPASKGLGAMEWMLFVPTTDFESRPLCPYLRSVSAVWLREVTELHPLIKAQARRPRDAEAVTLEYEEFINQWLSGLNKLWIGGIERPLKLKASHPPFSPSPRSYSDSAAAERALRWQTLRELAVLPQPLSIEQQLRSQGAASQANAWRAKVLQCDQALKQGSEPTALTAAAACLSQLGQLLNTQVAPSLQVTMGFSDGDGS
ncbi:MAG: imelysin family protein [Ideonella sp.]|nr:imelysin family protein [Ideonella sp.]